MKTMLKTLIVSIWMSGFYSLPSLAHEGHHSESKPAPILSESVFNISSTWTSQDGKPFSFSELKGQVAVIAMAYTSCEHACPLIIEDMRKIETRSKNETTVKPSFLIFSFDTDRDTPEQLAKYATKRNLPSPTWRLFHGDARAVRELAAVLGVKFKKDKNGDFDHSNVITLLDQDGLIRYQQTGLRQDPSEMISKIGSLGKK